MINPMSVLEAILFVSGESVPIKKLAEIIDMEIPMTRKMLQELQRQLETDGRGIRLVEINQAYQMTTAQECHPYIEKLCKQTRTKGMSPATMEVLAIIAYKQPVTKGEIETIRGVSCDKALRTLMERDLIETKERPGGKGYLYMTGEGFLRSFGLRSLKDLPVMDAFHQLSMREV